MGDLVTPGDDDWEYPTPEGLEVPEQRLLIPGQDDDDPDDWEDNGSLGYGQNVLDTPPGQVLQVPPVNPGDAAGLAWRYPYTPSDRQRLAHSLMVDEVFYGGAVGGGKTEYLLAECIQLCLRVPGVKTILFRKTFPELEQEIEPRILMRLPSPAIGRYNSSKHVFTFRNGSTLRLGYLDKAKDRYKYVGAEYQLMCYDEATHMRWDDIAFLRSRLRMAGPVRDNMNKLGLRPRMLLSSNPGGKSHGQIKRRYIDPAPMGDTVMRSKRSGITRVFVRSLSIDNPHLDHATYDQQLNELSDTHRSALRDGDWDVMEGIRFPEFRVRTHVVKPERLPLPPAGVLRGIGVDYGSTSPFAAVWGAKVRDDLVIIYREAYKRQLTPAQQAELTYEWSGPERDVGEGPRFLALDPACWIKDKDQPGVHSSRDKSLPPPGSIADAYRKRWGAKLMQGNNARIDGWALVDHHLRVRPDGFPRILIYDSCPELIRSLGELPRDDMDPEDVDTHSDDHLCHPAGTLVATVRGQVPIEDLAPGDEVWTRQGPRRVAAWAMSDPAGLVGEVRLSDGRVLRSTADHPYWVVGRGWVNADALRYGDMMEVWNPPQSSSTTAPRTGAGQTQNDARIACTTAPAAVTANDSTASFMRSTTAPYLTGGTSTTGTRTRTTTTPATWWHSPQVTMPRTTWLTWSGWSRPGGPLTLPACMPLSGTGRTRVGNGTASTLPARSRHARSCLAPAVTAARNTRPRATAGTGIAGTTAGPLPARHQGWTTSSAHASGAGARTPATGIPSPGGAPVHVAGSWRPVGRAPVYSLTVEGVHEFYADGVLASNCDALRYLLFAFVGKHWKRPQDRLHELTRDTTASKWRDRDPLMSATAAY